MGFYPRCFNIVSLIMLFGFFLLLRIFYIDYLGKIAKFSMDGNHIQNYKIPDSPQSNIAFLKIDKCGSSTTACLLLRYGFKNNLTMFLPHVPRVTDSNQTFLIDNNYTCNIFAIHTNYRYNFFTQVVNNPIIIGQVREPESRLISHAFFFLRRKTELKHLPEQTFINEVASNTGKYKTTNLMSKYFGISAKVQSKSAEFKEILMKLDSEFHLVLVLERFDDSLILLKRILNWTIGDIIYSKKKDHSLTTGDLQLDEYSRRIFQQTNKKDYELYDFFAKMLDKKINSAGKDFHDEVLHFKRVSKEAKMFCINGSTDSLRFPSSKWDSSFTLLRKDCNEITRMDVFQFKSRNYTTL